MERTKILVIGGGIGGLTTAIALRRKGFEVELIEKDANWTVHGVGIIQQFNVLRAMGELDLLDAYMDQAHGFDSTSVFIGDGTKIADLDAPRLAGAQYPSNAGIRRTALQKVLVERARDLGTEIRLGLTVEALSDDGMGVDVTFSDKTTGRYAVVIGADGVFSRTRNQIFEDAPSPRYTGQWVWRCNLPMPEGLKGIEIHEARTHAGLVPIGDDTMYIFLVTEEPAGLKVPAQGAAQMMRARAVGSTPQVSKLAEQITEDEAVVARPLEVVFVEGDWHKGRVVLMGDAIHAATPHLAQGAGMAIEDALVLAQELADKPDPESAFKAYRARRFARCKWVAETSIALGDSQMGKRTPPLDSGEMAAACMKLVSEPI